MSSKTNDEIRKIQVKVLRKQLAEMSKWETLCVLPWAIYKDIKFFVFGKL